MNIRLRLLLVVLPVLLGACGHAAETSVAPPGSASPERIVVRGRVDVEGGNLQLGLPVEGTISRVAVAAGQSVSKGALLLEADPTVARIDHDLAGARLEAAESQVKLWDARLAAAKTRAERLIQAASEDAGDRQSADDAREAVAQAIAELEGARAGVHIAQAEQKRTGWLLSQLDLRAPEDGEVLHVAAWPGLRVSPQSGSLVSLLPSKSRIVRAEVTDEFIANIKPEETAQILSDDGRLTLLGNARVERISPMFGVSQLQDDPGQHLNVRSVEVVLSVDQGTTLRVGQRVLVRFSTRPPAS